jgi:hypothetical protein
MGNAFRTASFVFLGGSAMTSRNRRAWAFGSVEWPAAITLTAVLAAMFSCGAQGAEPTAARSTVQVAALWDNIKDKAGGTSAELQDWSAGKLREALAEFANYLPVFREAGFEVPQVSVTLGLVPTLTATFAQVKVLKPEEQAAILKLHERKKVLSYMLRSLFKIYSLQMVRFKVTSTDMSFTVPPSTTVTMLVQSEETKPEDAKPGDAKPAEAKPGEAKPGEAKPEEVKPGEAKPEGAK